MVAVAHGYPAFEFEERLCLKDGTGGVTAAV